MATKSIDLEIKREPMTSPSKMMDMPHFPTLTIESKEDHGIPDSGTAVITFSKQRNSHSEDEDGKHRYSCTIEVQKMSNIKAGSADKADEGESETPAEDAAEGGTEEESPAPKKKRSPAVTAALSGEGDY